MDNRLIKNMVIYKFPLEPGLNNLELYEVTKFLDAQTQEDQPMLWVLVDSRSPRVLRQVVVVPTGTTLQADSFNWTYLNTFQLAAGRLVFHAFLLP